MIKFKATTGEGHYHIYLNGGIVGTVYKSIKYYALIGGRTKVTTWTATPNGKWTSEDIVRKSTRRDAAATLVKNLKAQKVIV